MNGKHGPPKGQPWVWLTRDMMGNESWRSLTINARRLLDFLMLEHMRHSGKQNGRLLAPRRQLEAFGIGAHFVSAAIQEAESLGFVAVKRGIGRRANTYALTWLPLYDQTGSTNDWQSRMTAEQQHHMLPNSSHNGRSDCQTAVITALNDCSLATAKQQHPSRRRSYQGRVISNGLDEEEALFNRVTEGVA